MTKKSTYVTISLKYPEILLNNSCIRKKLQVIIAEIKIYFTVTNKIILYKLNVIY